MSDQQEKDEEKFLSRWSRRKIDARRSEAEPKPAAGAPAMPPSGAAPGVPGAPLPPIEELRGLASEYRDFLRPEVDESLRRTALKKLFQDPHFNVMDGLDTYIDDYTKADPIPEAMLRTLNQAQGLIFDREDRTGVEQLATVDPAEPLPQVTEVAAEELEASRRSLPEATEKDDGNPPQPGPDTPSTTT
jgi:hypothetical protein